MSRAIFDAPTILPSLFLIGEMVSDTSTRLPSLRSRTVSKWSIRSPRRMRCSRAGTSSGWSAGTRTDSGWPTISSAV